MEKCTFATRAGRAYYYNSIPNFITDSRKEIIGALVQHSFDENKEQTDAWYNQIAELQQRLSKCGVDGDIIFEYDIIRLGKRIDVILLIRHMVFSLEFKNGKTTYTAQDAQQAEDYAIDIKNFHKESEDLYVCPILIATDAPVFTKEQSIECYSDRQVYLQKENIETLLPKVSKIANQYGNDNPLDFNKWFNSPYHPTPTIIAAAIEQCSRCHVTDHLHLNTSICSFRTDKQSQFVDALLNNDNEKAKEILQNISSKYPVYITRSFEAAKQWAKQQVRGSQRCGVLACSSAQRLKPEGIYVPKDIDVNNWFLAPTDDLRSSNMMEIVASEFKIQGLEIDWSVVCWDADLRRNRKNDDWEYYNFRGSKWVHRKKEEEQRYLISSYRVLLTRARQGMVIFVPNGVSTEEDPTRSKTYYDTI